MPPRVMLESIRHDLVHAVRSLTRSPAMTATILVVLAMGLGLTTSAFGVVDALFLRPLPFHDPGRLVVVEEVHRKQGYGGSSYRSFASWTRDSTVFEETALLGTTEAELGDIEPERVAVARVTASFFPLLGVRPQAGRWFLDAEESPGQHLVVILSHRGWQRWFGGRAEVLGRSLTLGGRQHTVVGVMPRGFHFNYGVVVDIWTPVTPEALDPDVRRHATFARRAPEATLAAANEQLAVLAARYERERPDLNTNWGYRVVPMGHASDWVDQPARTALLIALAASVAVLLIAGANVGCLLLARAVSRSRELSIEVALGASRSRIARVAIIEACLLSLGGALLGLIVARWFRTAVVGIVPSYLDLGSTVGNDAVAVGFALLLSVLGGVVVGLAPALHTASVDPVVVLKEESGTSSLGRGRARFMRGLIAGEVAAASALLAAAGLFLASLTFLLGTPLGYRTDDVLTLELRLPKSRYEEGESIVRLYDDLTQRIGRLPGVVSVAAGESLPLSGRYSGVLVLPEGQSEPKDARSSRALGHAVTPGYFRTLGVRLVEGRAFERFDRAGSPPVAVLSEGLVRRDWGGEDPLGRRVRIDGSWHTVVGVVGDVRHRGPTTDRIDHDVYIPHAQRPTGSMLLAVHTSTDWPELAPTVQAALHEVDPALRLSRADTMEAALGRLTAGERALTAWIGGFAILALILVTTGLFGVTAYTVAQRRREMGVRLALGAQPRDIVAYVVGRTLMLAMTGIVAGGLIAYVIARAHASLVYGVHPTAPLPYLVASVVILVTAFTASYLPARRASGLDPAQVLRS